LKSKGRRRGLRRPPDDESDIKSEEGSDSIESEESVDSTETESDRGEKKKKWSRLHRYKPYEKPKRKFKQEKHYKTQARDAFGRFLKSRKTEAQSGDGDSGQVVAKILDEITTADSQTFYLVRAKEGDEPCWLSEKDIEIVG
jgi:hypothetical protein